MQGSELTSNALPESTFLLLVFSPLSPFSFVTEEIFSTSEDGALDFPLATKRWRADILSLSLSSRSMSERKDASNAFRGGTD